jgi:uncharacterized Zn finger protein (UPF0148 family)
MKTYCPNCDSKIVINSEYVLLTICPICKKCVKTINKSSKENEQEQNRNFVQCIDNRKGEGIFITDKCCQ